MRFEPSVRTVADVGSVMSARSTPAAATVAGIIYLFGGGFDDYLGQTVTPYDTTFAFDSDTLSMARAGAHRRSAGTPHLFGRGR